jgi:hypothetical protein
MDTSLRKKTPNSVNIEFGAFRTEKSINVSVQLFLHKKCLARHRDR